MSFSKAHLPQNKFKNASGVYLTKALFLETADVLDQVLYTLRPEDYRGYPSLRRLYLSIADPTEYRFATECFDGWDHFEKVSGSPWLQPYLRSYRKELEHKLRSEAILGVIRDASSGSKTSASSRKLILDRGWETARGRPSAAEKARRLEEEATMVSDLKDEAERLGVALQ